METGDTEGSDQVGQAVKNVRTRGRVLGGRRGWWRWEGCGVGSGGGGGGGGGNVEMHTESSCVELVGWVVRWKEGRLSRLWTFSYMHGY